MHTSDMAQLGSKTGVRFTRILAQMTAEGAGLSSARHKQAYTQEKIFASLFLPEHTDKFDNQLSWALLEQKIFHIIIDLILLSFPLSSAFLWGLL